MYRAGIDLGGTNIKAGIVDEDQKILAEGSVPTMVKRPYQEIIKDMADLVKDLLGKIGAEERELSSVGVGSPGTVDAESGMVRYSNNFGWENTRWRKNSELILPVRSIFPMTRTARHSARSRQARQKRPKTRSF